MKKSALCFAFLCLIICRLCAQTKNVSGKVTDEKGLPLEGVSILIKGRSGGTATNSEGNFTLPAPGSAKALIISSTNFATQEIAIQGRSIFNISLKAATANLDEVMVVAYGTAKKASFTGSATRIDGKKIEQRPIINVLGALTGAAPGVTTNAGGGQPGSEPAVRIRGFGSINASNNPLYVVDGVPYDLNISNLNTEDIESISVLKDAASTSLYGSRAGNGVILITTKKGKRNSNQLAAKVTQGVTSRAIQEYKTVNASEYYPLMWEGLRNSLAYFGTTPLPAANANASANIKNRLGYNPFNVADNAIVRTDGALNPDARLLYPDDLDWFSPLTRTGSRGDYSIGMNGGSDKSDYYLSLGYTNEKGFVVKSDYERYTGRLNVNTQPLRWFRTGLNLATIVTKSNQSITSDASEATLPGESNTSYINPFAFARTVGPIYPVYLHDPVTGAFVLDARGNKQYDVGTSSPTMTRAAGGNPGRHVLEETLLNDNSFKMNTLSGRIFGEISFFRDFKFTSNISVDISNYRASTYENKIVGDGAPAGRSSRNNTTSTSITLNQLLNYNKTLGNHTLNLLAGHENYDFTYEYLYGLRQQQAFDGINELRNFTTTNELDSYTDKDKIESYFGRVNYTYNNKFLLSGSYRTDGSSRFYKSVRWGKFWSVGAGWRLDQESFFKNISWVNELKPKLRASYGETGNYFTLNPDGTQNYYPYQGLYDLGYDNVSNPGVLQSNLVNNDLSWESNKQFDAGIDFALLKSRLRGSLEFFNRQSDNLLFNVPLPLSSGTLTNGFASITMNIGSMYNRGFEIQLAGDLVKGKDFTWTIDANATTFKNQVTKMPPTQPELITGTSLSGGSVGNKKLAVGRSIYDYWLRTYIGVDSANGAALYRTNIYDPATSVITKNGDTVTTFASNARFHYAGTAIPDVYGGVTSTFTFRNVSLSVLFTYQLGGKVFDYNYATLMTSGITYGGALH
ncbi:MAG: SusC/RagA family TonB-linked outer membrane protein [Chitinophagaceae bacterium]